MQRKLLRIASFCGVIFATFGVLLTGCIDEPTIEPVGRMQTLTRFVNVCVDQPAVDIWVDSLRYGTLAYKEYTDYMDVPSGTRYFRVTPAGADTSEAILRGEVYFRSLTQFSVVVYGRSNVLSDEDAGRIGITTTQERYTYSDELKNLASDTAKIKLINCAVTHLETTKIGQMSLYDTMRVADTLQVRARIANVYAPPVTSSEPYNLSGYVKYPTGTHNFAVYAGQKFLPRTGTSRPTDISLNVERKYYTFIVTALLNDASTWDMLVLEDKAQ